MQKYVGFDCDECLAQVTQLMPFTEAEAPPEVLERFAELLVANDIPFIRPTFWPVLKAISTTSAIPFIYSNNGSLPTLQFVARLVDIRLARPGFFRAIAHYDNENRTDNTGGQYVKKWPSVKRFLEAEFSVENIQPEYVMFFDDLPHIPLSRPLRHYQRVAAFELPCVIGNREYSVDNSLLEELWKKAGAVESVETEESEGTGVLDIKEGGEFVKAFYKFMAIGGGRRRRRHTRRKRLLSRRTKTAGAALAFRE